MHKILITQNILKLLQDSMSWWLSELQSLLAYPLLWLKLHVFSRHELRIDEQGALQFYLLSKSGSRFIGTATEDSIKDTYLILKVSTFRRLMVRFWPLNIMLSIDDKYALVKDIKLPIAVEKHIESAISYDLVRHLPYARREIFFGWKLVAKNRENDLLTVRICAVPNKNFILLTEKFAQINVQFKTLIINTAEEKTLFEIPLGNGSIHPKLKNSMLIILNFIVGLSFISASLYLPFYRANQQLNFLNSEISLVEKPAKEAVFAREKTKELNQAYDLIGKWKNKSKSSLLILETLSKEISLNAWIYELNYTKQHIDIKGYAVESAELIGVLENLPFVDKAEFISPVIREQNSVKEHFQVRVKLRAGV